MSVQNWLSRVGENTRRDYNYTFNRFEMWKLEYGGKFADMSPDELIEYQKSCSNSDCFEILDLIQRWILGMSGLAYRTKDTYYMTLLSFFLHNRAELPKDKSFKIRGDKPKTPSLLRPEHIRHAVLHANPMYRAMITCMLEGSMGIAEVIEWNNNGWKSLREQLIRGEDIIRVELPGRKSERNIRPFFTLIGGDALKFLKEYLGTEIPEERAAIFTNQYGRAVNEIALKRFWLRHLIRLRIVEKEVGGDRGTRYGYGLHELRENFRTLWSQSRANPDIGEFLMGHKLDDYGYNQVFRDYDYVVAEYRKALPYLNVLSGEFSTERNEKMRNLESENKILAEKVDALMARIENGEMENPAIMKLILDLTAKVKNLEAGKE